MSTDAGLAQRLALVRSELADSAGRHGRVPDELTLIVVTKFHPAELVHELAALGVTDVGENRHPEARDKREACLNLDLNWHFIGQIQRNKAAQIAAYADAIHSLDRPELIEPLNRAGRDIDVFVQINLTDDPGRGGVAESELLPLAEQVLSSRHLRLRGLMAVAGLGEDPRKEFARVRSASERLQTVAPEATSLSIGMSADFDAAIAEGATHLRIGTAITGKRPISA